MQFFQTSSRFVRPTLTLAICTLLVGMLTVTAPAMGQSRPNGESDDARHPISAAQRAPREGDQVPSEVEEAMKRNPGPHGQAGETSGGSPISWDDTRLLASDGVARYYYAPDGDGNPCLLTVIEDGSRWVAGQACSSSSSATSAKSVVASQTTALGDVARLAFLVSDHVDSIKVEERSAEASNNLVFLPVPEKPVTAETAEARLKDGSTTGHRIPWGTESP